MEIKQMLDTQVTELHCQKQLLQNSREEEKRKLKEQWEREREEEDLKRKIEMERKEEVLKVSLFFLNDN